MGTNSITKVDHVGVIGAGYWGKKHVEELTRIGLKVTVSDLIDSNLEFCKNKFGCLVIKNYIELLKKPEIRAVTIAAPNELHFQICKNALENGKNVLLEKPMTTSYSQAKELVDLANRLDLVLNVGHIYRFNNAIRKIKSLLDADYFGEVQIVKLTWTNREPVWNRDIIFDLAPHPFDIIHFLLGKNPEEVACIGEAYRRVGGEEAAFVNAKVGKTLVNLEMSWLTPEKIRRLVLVGSDKTAFVDCLTQEIKIHDHNTKENTPIIQTQPNNTLQDELKRFVETIESGNRSKSIADGQIGAEIVKILEFTKRSLDEKRVLTVE